MRILIAPDSFKECLSAAEVARNIAIGISRVMPDAKITSIPIADGGEGTVEALITATNGSMVAVDSVDALMRPVQSFYGILGDGKTAVIEMAAASGLGLLANSERNPLITSTFGTGLLIKTALEHGYTNIILGIGGSATNDAGVGMAQALGFCFLDKENNELPPGGGSLNKLKFFNSTNANPLLKFATIRVACDVNNPLCGENGASAVYGPQKGATPEMVKMLDNNLLHFSEIIKNQLGKDVALMPGSGAAGGLGAGLLAFTNATLQPGFEIIKNITNLESHIQQADLIYTAEGKIDSQTQYGKTPFGVAQIALKYKLPVIALAGVIGEGAEILYEKGITSIFALADKPMSIEDSILDAGILLQNIAERSFRLFSFKNKYLNFQL